MEGRKNVSSYLSSKSGFILVSHDRAFLDNCVDHILSINRTKIEVQKGNFSSWCENRRRQDHFELSENERLRKEMDRLAVSARRTANWSSAVEKTKHGANDSGLKPDRGYIGHKSAKMMKRSKSIASRRLLAIEEKRKLLKDTEETEKLKIFQLGYHGKCLVELDKVTIYYGDWKACREISLSIDQGTGSPSREGTDRGSRA